MKTIAHRRARELTRRSDAAFNRHILDVAPHLADADRILVTQYFLHDVPLADLAAFRRVSVRQIQRDIQRISRTIAEPAFASFLTHRHQLPTPDRTLATLHFLHGLSLRAIAAKNHWTLYRTHKTIQQLKTKLLLCTALPTPAPPKDEPLQQPLEPEEETDPFFQDDD